MSPQTILLDGQQVIYTLKRSKRRTIGFTISRDGLTIAAPQRTSKREIERGMREKSRWILTKLAEWAARPKPVEPVFETGETLSWLGGQLTLDIEPRGVRTRVTRRDDTLHVTLDPQLEGALRMRTLKTALARFYKREGLALMAPKVETYAAALDRRVSKVIVRDQKRRWGSCASDASIRLNWRLMGFPVELLDYVCAHEAAHLVEANHSARYWAVVTSIMPDWKQRRARMRAEADIWIPF